MNSMIQLKTILLSPLVGCMLACFGFLPGAQAVVPAPDGGYPGFNTAEGQNALFSLTTGTGNVAVGWGSLYSDTFGSFNTAIGTGALLFNTAGENTATGAGALLFNNGAANTANGAFALHNNTTGSQNTAIGLSALQSNTIGDFNTANGYAALFSNTTGGDNTANGEAALFDNTTGGGNTATGGLALTSNITGAGNTASGYLALYSNTAGHDNTATGTSALLRNTTGSGNTANGVNALGNNTEGAGNTAIGNGALASNSTGSFNVALNGGNNLTTGIFNIDIANDGVAGESYTTRIGILQNRCFISGIREVTTGIPNAINVMIDSAGQLGTVSSSKRFKHNIKGMDCASEAIHALKPVTFHYKSDASDTPQFGLIAEEVAEVNPNLVVRDENGDIYTVRYDAVNAMLLNEFLKEHRKNEEQEAIINRLQKQIEALTTGLQKVSAQLATASLSRGGLEASEFATERILGGGPAPQVVSNNQ